MLAFHWQRTARMWLNVLILIVGFVLLIYSADRFVIGTSAIARNLGIPPMIIGLTIVGIGTSAPEILVSGLAAWQGNPGLAVGNAVGSNIANIGLVLGATALLMPVSVHSGLLKRELPLVLATSVASYFLILDGTLSRLDGSLLMLGLFLFLIWLVRSAKNNRSLDPLTDEFDQEIPKGVSTKKATWLFLLGLIGLLISSRMLVWAAVNIATALGVSDLLIGLTIVAIGTSLPELAASIASVLKKEDDLAVGNIIGSNMFNLLAVFSLPGLIAPGPMERDVLVRDFPAMLIITLVLFLMVCLTARAPRINRASGGLLLLLFGAYMVKLYLDTTGTAV